MATIRAIEYGKLRLSPKFAQRLSALTGIHVGKLMRNNLGIPLPSAVEVRRKFAQAQGIGSLPKNATVDALLLRAFITQSLVAEELGPEACLHCGFFDVVQKAMAKILWTVPTPKRRLRIFQRSREMSVEEMLEYIEKALDAFKQVSENARPSTKKNR
jgi:hypothetical protein